MLITWEDKLHDKMTSAYSKSCGYKKFSAMFSNCSTLESVFKKFRFRGSFYAYWSFGVDGSRIRNNKVAFSNLSGIVWTGPYLPNYQHVCFCFLWVNLTETN